jgi:pimeloyl-ACP methyl ester carboxylesterase
MNINYEESGRGNPKVVIFVHGAGGSSATWTMQLRILSSHFHIVALDLNGHGETPDRQEENILESYIKDIGILVDQFDRPILVGHSMGGALTQLYALKNPSHLQGIILVGTGARLRVSPIIFELLDNDFDGYISALGKFAFHPNTSKELIEASLSEIRKCPPKIIRRDFELCDAFDIMEEVNEISLPTLILVGDNDQMTPPKYSLYLNENINGATYQIIENAGHSLMLEQAELFNDIILKWIRTIT